MTREDDTYVPLAARAELANRIPNSIFISIHFNASSNRNAAGIETFILSPQGTAHYGAAIKKSDWNMREGNKVDSANIALATAIHSNMVQSSNQLDRGIKYARFSVLNRLNKPGLLIEGGFMSNNTEKYLIHKHNYQRNLSEQIANAINKFNGVLSL
jgi:N-acetylmuramoyl-L-alanine amidase